MSAISVRGALAGVCALALVLASAPSFAASPVTPTGQNGNAQVINSDGTAQTRLGAGSAIAGKFGIDQTTPGTTNGVQINGGTLPAPYKPTFVPLDVATVTTGTPATVLSVNHRTAGGFIITSNAAGMCVSENGTAGTTTGYSGGVATVCVVANQPYTLTPSANAVSVTSTGTGVAISGYGLQ